MRPYTRGVLAISLPMLALAAMSLFPGAASALDWRVIQDELGTQASPIVYWPTDSTPLFHSFQLGVRASQVYPRGGVLFEQDFERGTLGEGHPEVTLCRDPDGKGTCARFSTSEYRLQALPVPPGHWIMVSWKARTVSGGGVAYLEASYKDAEGKPLGQPERHQASSGGPGADWTEELWSLVPSWSYHPPVMPPETRSIGLRFFHEPGDQTVTLIDDIRVVDIQPVALQVVADIIADHQRLLATAAERIGALPDSPKTRLWQQVVATHSDRIASQLASLAQQDPTSEEFIHGSDPPLLFARRLADAAEALESGLAHPATILTYRTRPIPVNGPFYYHGRIDPVGVRPYAVNIEGELANRVTIQACRGEYEPVSIALWSPENMDQVSVHASDLQGPAGRIPAANLDIKVVKCWYQRSPMRPGWQVLVPKFLLNDDSLVKVDLNERRNYLKLSFPEGSRYVDPPSYAINDPVEEESEEFPLRDSDALLPFDLVGGQNKQVWITVKVPDEAAAGRYSGDVILKAGEREIARFAVAARVLPFSLPAPGTQYDPSQEYTFSIYYRGRLNMEGKGKVGHTTKSEQQFRAELRIMYEHGIVAPLMLLHGTFPRGTQPEPLFRRHLEIMCETGMSGRPLYLGENVGAPSAEEDLARLRQNVRTTVSIAREYGFTDVYFYGQDEAVGEVLQSQRPAWQAVHEAGGKVQVSVMYGSLHETPDLLDLLIAAQWPQRALAGERHHLGHKIHSYSFPHTDRVDPLIYRRNCGLYLWSYNYDGITPYCFMHNCVGVWNDLDGPGPDYNIAFPTVNGVIGTLALEGLREGADDVRYATLLMKRIEEARDSGTPEAKAVAEEAFQWIEKEEFLIADLDLVRTRMVDYIIALTQE